MRYPVLLTLIFSPKMMELWSLFFYWFWGPLKLLRSKYLILDIKVCLKKLGIGSGLYGKSVLYLLVSDLLYQSAQISGGLTVRTQNTSRSRNECWYSSGHFRHTSKGMDTLERAWFVAWCAKRIGLARLVCRFSWGKKWCINHNCMVIKVLALGKIDTGHFFHTSLIQCLIVLGIL
jgi:hypothetical protein